MFISIKHKTKKKKIKVNEENLTLDTLLSKIKEKFPTVKKPLLKFKLGDDIESIDDDDELVFFIDEAIADKKLFIDLTDKVEKEVKKSKTKKRTYKEDTSDSGSSSDSDSEKEEEKKTSNRVFVNQVNMNQKKKSRSSSDSSSSDSDSSEDDNYAPKRTVKHVKPKQPINQSYISHQVTHMGINCHNCKIYPIKGKRYTCITCKDYNICQTCERNSQHGHPMIRFANQSKFSRPVIIEEEELMELRNRPAVFKNESGMENVGKNYADQQEVGFTPSFGKSKIVPTRNQDMSNDNNTVQGKVGLRMGGIAREQILNTQQKKDNWIFMEDMVGTGNEDIKEKLIAEFGDLDTMAFYAKLEENLHEFPG